MVPVAVGKVNPGSRGVQHVRGRGGESSSRKSPVGVNTFISQVRVSPVGHSEEVRGLPAQIRDLLKPPPGCQTGKDS